jgi:Glycosyltransferase family 87
MQEFTSTVEPKSETSTMKAGFMFRHPVAAQLIALAFALAMVYYHLFLFVPRVRALEMRAAGSLGNGYSFGDDFYPVWLTSREALLHHSDPYSPEITREIQIGLFGRPLDARRPSDPPMRYREFAYPAFVCVLFWPLAYLPFPVVRPLLAVLLPVTTAIGILLWLRAMRLRTSPSLATIIILLTLSSYPILEALFAEQLGLVVGWLMAASMASLIAGRYATAGFFLALAAIKPQMVILLIFSLLLWSFVSWRERHRFAETFAATGIMLCGSAFLIWPHWLQQWLEVLLDYRNYSSPPLVVDLLGRQFGSIFGPALMAVLIAFGLLIACRVRDYAPVSPEFRLAVALLLVVTAVAILPGQAVYDHIVLLPAILVAVRLWGSRQTLPGTVRRLLFITAGIVFWQWVAALALVAIRPLIPDKQFYAANPFLLPIRFAEPLPFALLALLAAMMRHSQRAG